MSSQDRSAWASIPWTPFADGASDSAADAGKTLGWHKARVPYAPGGVSLQTLDVWIPASADDDDPTGAVPDAGSLPSRPGHWIVFIHGGAWRDSKISASSFTPTATHLLRAVAAGSGSGTGAIAGLASLNYRLSPRSIYDLLDSARTAKHPDHINDVLSGLAFLQRLGGATGTYVLAGHSCGATLSFQAVMDPARWGLATVLAAKPAVLVGLNGLYDLAGFIASPPAKYAHLREAYAEFTRGAFGDDESVWKAACPATAESWPDEWKEGKRVVLVESREDSLVPYDQLEEMRAYLRTNSSLLVQEREATGDHDDVWEKGDRLAEILQEVISGL
ncbi:Alpha/Beta hydrolase protein [Bombardia bombarda]|uniref:Kynurenine formamidase n=1 Tax=Bombardia bombarda TaxID=252184 RepID=A0AA40CDJ0_9PEZI|nr:Alpha/Beta hydrolase protein [Bombardia bombarda]